MEIFVTLQETLRKLWKFEVLKIRTLTWRVFAEPVTYTLGTSNPKIWTSIKPSLIHDICVLVAASAVLTRIYRSCNVEVIMLSIVLFSIP